MANSTRKGLARKWKVAGFTIKRPFIDFPLSPHACGAWCKRILGRLRFFGRWARQVNGKLERLPDDGWQEALQVYKSQAEDLHAGRQPQPKKASSQSATLADLCNAFLTSKQKKLDAGEIGRPMFQDYYRAAELLLKVFGKRRMVNELTADDFADLREKMSKRYGPVRLGNEIVRIRSIFKYAAAKSFIEKPIDYQDEFETPDRSVLRRHRAQQPPKMFEPDQLRTLIGLAERQMKAMLLLALNAGYGNTDVATLPMSALDLERGWVTHARPKTGIPRRCPLWPETQEALQEVLATRPESMKLVFLNENGKPWVRITEKQRTDLVTTNFTRLLKQSGLHQFGLGFYTLRHVHRTISDGAKDRVAADLIMGHADNSMAGHYVEQIDDARLVAVAEHVRAWLFAAEKKEPKGNDKPPTLKVFAG